MKIQTKTLSIKQLNSGVISALAVLTLLLMMLMQVHIAQAASYTLTVSNVINGMGFGGTVTSNPAGINCGAGSVCPFSGTAGTTVTLTAVTGIGSTFAGWSGAGCSGTGICVVTLNSSQAVTATFNTAKYPVKVVKSGNGSATVKSNVGGIDCGSMCISAPMDFMAYYTLTAWPAVGSHIDSVSGDGCLLDTWGKCNGDFTVGATGNTATVAVLLNTYEMNVVKTGNGSGTVKSSVGGINCGSSCLSSAINYGTPVTFTPTPAVGSYFIGWPSDIGCSGTGTCTMTVDGSYSTLITKFNLNATPNYAVIHVAKVVSGGAKGASNFNIHVYRPGEVYTEISDSPAPGVALPGKSYKVDMPLTDNQVVLSVIEDDPTPLSYSVAYSGACDAGGNITLNAGDDKTCIVTNTSTSVPVTGTLNVITKVVGGSAIPSGFLMYVNNMIGWAAAPGSPYMGMGFPGKVFILNAGTYLVDEDGLSNYSISYSSDCDGSGHVTVVADESRICVVTNTYSPAPPPPANYVIKVVKQGAGSGTVTSSTGNINCGGNCNSTAMASGTAISLTATAAVGSTFTGWSGGGCSGAGVCSTTFDSNKTVTATFTVVPPAPPAPPGPPSFCFPVTRVGQYVVVGGVTNSGKLFFDQLGTAPNLLPDDQHRACMEDPNGDGVPEFVMKGWAWNDNLGWISFYCGDEDNNALTAYTNRGIACGIFKYGVTIPAIDGKFSGYAYGDNIGYISFDNHLTSGLSQLRLEADDGKCQGYVYATNTFKTKNGVACPSHDGSTIYKGKISTHIWADSVGWLDMEDVLFPWYTLTKSITNVKVNLNPDPRKSVKPGEAGAAKTDGTLDYKLDVSILDKQNVPVLSGPTDRYTVTIIPTWAVDTVKMNQIDAGEGNVLVVNTPCGTPNDPNRAVKKPCYDTMVAGPAPFIFGGGLYSASISSAAPTTNENQSVKSDGKYISNELFTLPAGKKAPQPNDLKLESVAVKIWDKDAGQCAFAGDWSACTPKIIPINGTDGSVDLRFKPATTFTISNPDVKAGDYLSATAGNTESLNMSSTGSGKISLHAGIDSNLGSYKYGLTETQETTSGDDILPNLDHPANPVVFNPAKKLYALLVSIKGQVDQYISGLYIYSEIEEAGVKYYGGKLPRVIGSYGAQPVAVTTGNVYATCMSQTTSTTGDVRSLGDISSNKLRDTFARNVAALTAGIKNPGGWDEVKIDNNMLAGCTSGGSLKCAADNNVFYVKGNAVLQEGGTPGAGTISWTGNKTIVVVGGYLKINSNILPAGAGAAKPRLGIIVMKDYSNTDNPNPKMAGNVYIESKVRDVQANIVATDGALLSYVDDSAHGIVKVTGLPKFSSTDDMEASLKSNQLWISGSLASNNTIGGATATTDTGNKMFNGLCQVETDPVRARLFDLNYLRQYLGEYQRDANGAPVKGNKVPATGELTQKELIKDGKPWAAVDDGYLYPPADGTASTQNKDVPRNLGSTYLVFDPPPSTLPGFAGENIFAVVIRPQ